MKYVLAAIILLAFSSCAFGNPYPNELDNFKLYEKYCGSLEPLKSTADDVKAVLGEPLVEKSSKSVLWYEKDSWKILVYLYPDNGDYPKYVVGKIQSIDFIPAIPLAFGRIDFSPAFAESHIISEIQWNEYCDAHGLAYAVFTSKPPWGKEKAGDLNRISYRAAPQRIIQLQKWLIQQLRVSSTQPTKGDDR